MNITVKNIGIDYISDFDIVDKNGYKTVIDIKGFLKPIDKIKEKLLLCAHPEICFKFIGESKIDGGFVELDIILQNRKKRKKLKRK